jgi:peroxiredoxin
MKMRRSFLLACLAAGGAVAVLALVRADTTQPATQPADEADATTLVGKAAPPFTLKGPDGSSFTLSQARGHVVVLDFFASYCIPCRLEQKDLTAIDAPLKPEGLLVFAIDTQDDPAKVLQYISENKLALPVLIDADESVGNAYKVVQMPETVIVGKDGTVRQVFTKFSQTQTPPLLEQAIKAAMSETK